LSQNIATTSLIPLLGQEGKPAEGGLAHPRPVGEQREVIQLHVTLSLY